MSTSTLLFNDSWDSGVIMWLQELQPSTYALTWFSSRLRVCIVELLSERVINFSSQVELIQKTVLAGQWKIELPTSVPIFSWPSERQGMGETCYVKNYVYSYSAVIDFRFCICWTVATSHIKIHHPLCYNYNSNAIPPPWVNQYRVKVQPVFLNSSQWQCSQLYK